LFWPDLFVLGGGVSADADKFVPRLTCRTPVVAAQLLNQAGIIGAALVTEHPVLKRAH
jgi:polyphosphate glucokinase